MYSKGVLKCGTYQARWFGARHGFAVQLFDSSGAGGSDFRTKAKHSIQGQGGGLGAWRVPCNGIPRHTFLPFPMLLSQYLIVPVWPAAEQLPGPHCHYAVMQPL